MWLTLTFIRCKWMVRLTNQMVFIIDRTTWRNYMVQSAFSKLHGSKCIQKRSNHLIPPWTINLIKTLPLHISYVQREIHNKRFTGGLELMSAKKINPVQRFNVLSSMPEVYRTFEDYHVLYLNKLWRWSGLCSSVHKMSLQTIILELELITSAFWNMKPWMTGSGSPFRRYALALGNNVVLTRVCATGCKFANVESYDKSTWNKTTFRMFIL